jgi:hypothetical protein
MKMSTQEFQQMRTKRGQFGVRRNQKEKTRFVPDVHPVREELNRTALSVIQTMVNEGFTFFNSIQIDHTTHDFETPTNFGDYAFGDVMFFHVPDKAILVRLELVVSSIQHRATAGPVRDLVAKVFTGRYLIHRTLKELAEYWRLCRDKGYIKYVAAEYPPYYHDVPAHCVPWIDEKPTDLLKEWGTFISKAITPEYTMMMAMLANCWTPLTLPVTNLAQSIQAVAPYVDEGKLKEIHTPHLYPYLFRPVEGSLQVDEFWEKFNSRYYRTLVK